MKDEDAERLYRSQKKKAEANQLEVDETVRVLLSVSRGRKYLWWLLTIGKVGTQPFANNALQTSFACGELNVGQQILAHIISVDPAGYVRMMQENAENERSSNADTGTDSDASTGSDD